MHEHALPNTQQDKCLLMPGILVVLFHPNVEHAQHILTLKQLCDRVTVVDNSKVCDATLHRMLHGAGIDVLRNGNVGGIAGAFNRGLDHLVQNGCHLLFLFDQDSIIDEPYWNSMLAAGKHLDGQRYMVGPKVFDINVERYLPAHILHKWRIENVPISDAECGLLPCSCLISSGTMLTAETYKYLGRFREDYFIDQVDTEYSFRAINKGVAIYINTDATLPHQISKRQNRTLWGKSVTQWNMTPLRQYYSARNCLLIARNFGIRYPLLSLVNIITFFQLISILLYEQQKRQKLTAMTAGLLDGFRGRSGPFEDLWHRVAIYCTPKHAARLCTDEQVGGKSAARDAVQGL